MHRYSIRKIVANALKNRVYKTRYGSSQNQYLYTIGFADWLVQGESLLKTRGVLSKRKRYRFRVIDNHRGWDGWIHFIDATQRFHQAWHLIVEVTARQWCSSITDRFLLDWLVPVVLYSNLETIPGYISSPLYKILSSFGSLDIEGR